MLAFFVNIFLYPNIYYRAVFHNKYCDKIKMLYWNTEGFCLLYKRIEKGRFRFPTKIDSPVYTITEEELLWLLHGLKIEDIRHYKKVVSEQ